MNSEKFNQLSKWLEVCFTGLERKSGGPMCAHSIEVAEILNNEGWNDIVVFAGGSHDLLEDTKTTKKQIVQFATKLLENEQFALKAADLAEFCCYSEYEYSLPKLERKKVACERWINSNQIEVFAIKNADVTSNKLSMHGVLTDNFVPNYLAWADPLQTALRQKLEENSDSYKNLKM